MIALRACGLLVVSLLVACATGPTTYQFNDRGYTAPAGQPKPIPFDGDGRAQLGMHDGRELRKGNLEDYPERPTLAKGHEQAWAMFNVCVSKQGIVESVSILRPPGTPGMSDQWMAAIRTWRYKTYENAEGPHPFCYPQRLEVKAD
jgi:TonB family protein